MHCSLKNRELNIPKANKMHVLQWEDFFSCLSFWPWPWCREPKRGGRGGGSKKVYIWTLNPLLNTKVCSSKRIISWKIVLSASLFHTKATTRWSGREKRRSTGCAVSHFGWVPAWTCVIPSGTHDAAQLRKGKSASSIFLVSALCDSFALLLLLSSWLVHCVRLTQIVA